MAAAAVHRPHSRGDSILGHRAGVLLHAGIIIVVAAVIDVLPLTVVVFVCTM